MGTKIVHYTIGEYRRRLDYNTLRQSVSATQGSWRLLSHNYGATQSYAPSLFVSYTHYCINSNFCVCCSTLYVKHNVCPRCIYTHTQYWVIYKYSPQWHIIYVCRYIPKSASTNSTIVRIYFDLIIRPP